MSILVLPLFACAARPADLDELLRAPAPDAVTLPDTQERLARYDEAARLGILASDRRSDDPGLAMVAARALFRAADVRMLQAALEMLDASGSTEVEDWIAAADSLPDDTKSEVLSLVLEGKSRAEQALELDPGRADALLYRALHLSLEAWAIGPTSALARGMGGRVPKAIRAAIQADADLESAAPLRLMGRFLDRAPWPLRDRSEARDLLSEATERAPVSLNLLFLGDVLYGLGDVADARSRWMSASEAPCGVLEPEVADLVRELALGRLRAVAPEGP